MKEDDIIREAEQVSRELAIEESEGRLKRPNHVFFAFIIAVALAALIIFMIKK